LKGEIMNKKADQVAREALTQAKSEGMDDEDAKWMAVGAVNQAARKAGIVGEKLTPEMNAASQAVVKQEQKKYGK